MDPSLSRFLDRLQREFVVVFSEEEESSNIYLVDLSRYRMRVSSETLLILGIGPSYSQSAKEILGRVATIKQRVNPPDGISILVVDGDAEPIRRAAHRSFFDLLILGSKDIDSILGGGQIQVELSRAIRMFLDLSTLSPYQTSGPATQSMFFGRDPEIRRIVGRQNTSFAVWGMRRIGKTSLLQEARLRLTKDRGLPVDHVLFIDCGSMVSMADYIARATWTVLKPSQMERMSYSEFPRFLRSYSSDGKYPITYILDEVDNLVRVDAEFDNQLQKVLRSSSASGHCRYILSGFRAAREGRPKISSPLFNFAEDIYLGGLSLEDTRRLIVEPFTDMGIRIVDSESLVSRIYQETGGQAHLTQFYCQRLVEAVAKHRGKRINGDDLNEVYRDPALGELIMGTFDENTDALEKLIVYVNADVEDFTLKSTVLTLRRNLGVFPPVDAVRRAMGYLEFIGAIRGKDRAFRFASPLLQNLLKKKYDIKFLIDRAKGEGSMRRLFSATNTLVRIEGGEEK